MLPKLQPVTGIIGRYLAVHEFIWGSQEMEVMPYLIRKAIYLRFVKEFQIKHVIVW